MFGDNKVQFIIFQSYVMISFLRRMEEQIDHIFGMDSWVEKQEFMDVVTTFCENLSETDAIKATDYAHMTWAARELEEDI